MQKDCQLPGYQDDKYKVIVLLYGCGGGYLIVTMKSEKWRQRPRP